MNGLQKIVFYLLCPLSLFSCEVGIDFLWWKPLVDNLDCAYTSEGNSKNFGKGGCVLTFDYKTITPKWEPGVRANLVIPKALCTWDAAFSFTWIKSDAKNYFSVPKNDEHKHLVNTLIQPYLDFYVEGVTTNVAAEWNSKYIDADLLFKSTIKFGSCSRFSPYLGVAGLYFKQEEQSESFSSTDTLFAGRNRNCPTEYMNWHSRFWGVGLRLGANYNQAFTPCLNLFGDANATILAGKIGKTENNQHLLVGLNGGSNIYNDFTFRQESVGHFVPGCHLQGGVEYNTSVWCRDLSLRLGYEFLYWLNLPNPRAFDMSLVDDVATGDVFVGRVFGGQNRSVGFDGLFVGVDIAF